MPVATASTEGIGRPPRTFPAHNHPFRPATASFFSDVPGRQRCVRSSGELVQLLGELIEIVSVHTVEAGQHEW